MNFFCKIFGCTWVHKTDNPRVSWNTGKSLSELHITTDEEPRFWLQCERCGDKRENPTKDEIKSINS